MCMFCILFYTSMFVGLCFFLYLTIVLYVLIWFTDSDYPFGIFNLFFPDTSLSSICSRSNYSQVCCFMINPNIILIMIKGRVLENFGYTKPLWKFSETDIIKMCPVNEAVYWDQSYMYTCFMPWKMSSALCIPVYSIFWTHEHPGQLHRDPHQHIYANLWMLCTACF